MTAEEVSTLISTDSLEVSAVLIACASLKGWCQVFGPDTTSPLPGSPGLSRGWEVDTVVFTLKKPAGPSPYHNRERCTYERNRYSRHFVCCHRCHSPRCLRSVKSLVCVWRTVRNGQ